jgi:hypothetical protein
MTLVLRDGEYRKETPGVNSNHPSHLSINILMQDMSITLDLIQVFITGLSTEGIIGTEVRQTGHATCIQNCRFDA